MNDEKDRFGDFIRLLERAREDVYFAEKDRELIEKLKRRLEQARQGQLENPTMTCPRCSVHLHNASLLDIPVMRCSVCSGLWLDDGVLPRFMNREKIEPAAGQRKVRESLRNVWPVGLGHSGGTPRNE